MDVLLDTNVVIDFLLRRPEGFVEADAIFVSLQNREFVGFVNSITILNAVYTCRKEIGKPAALSAVQKLLKIVQIAPADTSVLRDAFSLGFADYEDAVQCCSAVAFELDAIVTRNKKDFAKSPLPVYSPAEFVEVLGASSDEEEEMEVQKD